MKSFKVSFIFHVYSFYICIFANKSLSVCFQKETYSIFLLDALFWGFFLRSWKELLKIKPYYHIFGLLCVILYLQGPPGEKGEKGDIGFPGLQVFPIVYLVTYQVWMLNWGHIFQTTEKCVVGVNLNRGLESGEIQGMLVCSNWFTWAWRAGYFLV